MTNLESIVKKRKIQPRNSGEHSLSRELIQIIFALEKLQIQPETPEAREHREEIEKEIKKETKVDRSRNILKDQYVVRMQQSFYQTADYDKMYEHMGNSRLPFSHFITFSTKSTQAVVEEYQGEMSNVQAESTVQKIMYMQLFGTTDNISIEEKERFTHWRHFNKAKRRFYEAIAPIKYKPMHMNPIRAAKVK